MAVPFDAGHDAVVYCEAVAVVSRLKRFDKDCVGFKMVGQHDVMISAARSNRKSAHVISVKLADWIDEHMQFSGLDFRELSGDVGERFFVGLLGFFGAIPLPGLRQVDF